MRALILTVLLIAILALLLHDNPSPDEVHVVASRATTEITAWPQQSLPSLPENFDQLVHPQVRARTAPTRTPRVAADAIPDMIRAAFARFGAAVAEQAVRVATCESRLNPAALNGQHLGLFQISRTYHAARVQRMGFQWADMASPGPNIAVAASIYSESKWGPWTCRSAA